MHARLCVSLALCLLASACYAQDGRLNLPAFTALQSQAVESVNVSLDSNLLRFAGEILDDEDAEVPIRKTLAGLQSVTVRSYRFDKDGLPSQTEINDLRRQLAGPGWSALAQVHDRHEAEDVEIYLARDGEVIRGMAVLCVSPREFTLVHLVGVIKPADVAALQGHFADEHGRWRRHHWQ